MCLQREVKDLEANNQEASMRLCADDAYLTRGMQMNNGSLAVTGNAAAGSTADATHTYSSVTMLPLLFGKTTYGAAPTSATSFMTATKS